MTTMTEAAAIETTRGRYSVFNIDRQHNAGFGGAPSGFDRACVIANERTEPNVLTGKPQPAVIFSGTLDECWAFVGDVLDAESGGARQ
jgi:hypothetical protein